MPLRINAKKYTNILNARRSIDSLASESSEGYSDEEKENKECFHLNLMIKLILLIESYS